VPTDLVFKDPLVELIEVSFSYEDSRPVLSGVSLRIPRGKVVAIMGGSGSGKTTILRLIGGSVRARRGSRVTSCNPRATATPVATVEVNAAAR